MFVLQSVLEFSVTAFIIWGLFHEDALIRFEDKIITKFRKHMKYSKKKQNVYRNNTNYHTDERSCA